jgi:hypothetical protein
MTASELIEELKKYPPNVKVFIKISEYTSYFGINAARPINNIYPSSFEDERAICICFENCEEDEEE